MFAVLKTLNSPFETISTPLAVMLVIAVAALGVIGVAVRRLRAHGTLTFANASTSAAAATLVLAGALLASASIGLPTAAIASTTHSTTYSTSTHSAPPNVATSTDDGYQQIPLEGLEGYQLPTE